MAGLDDSGFTPLSYEDIKSNIESRLEQYNAGFDFSPESPDGQLIAIMSALLSQVWFELDKVYHSFNPHLATGQALRNIGLMTGLYKGSATRSQAVVTLGGTANVVVPKGSIVSDGSNEFYTNKDTYLPANATVLAVLSGPTPIVAGTIDTIVSAVAGWDTVVQSTDGQIGTTAQSETAYRNMRNATVMRNARSIQESMVSALLELSIEQVTVLNNDTALPLSDGTPAGSIHVIIGEFSGIDEEDIANTIFVNKGLGVDTYGSSSTIIQDINDNEHVINYTLATAQTITISAVVIYHSDNTAGAKEQVQSNLAAYVNSIEVGGIVIWSKLFGEITSVADAEVVSVLLNGGVVNVALDDDKYSVIDPNDIVIT